MQKQAYMLIIVDSSQYVSVTLYQMRAPITIQFEEKRN